MREKNNLGEAAVECGERFLLVEILNEVCHIGAGILAGDS